MDDTDTFRIDFGTDGTYDRSRDAVSQIYTDDNRIYRLERQNARGRERLQDTDGGTGTLQYKRDACTGRITDDRVAAQSGQKFLECTGLCEAAHRTGHVKKTGKQDTESDRNAADDLRIPELRSHDQDDTDNECDGGE